HLDPAAATEVSKSPIVEQTGCPSEERASVIMLHGQAYAVGSRAICTEATREVGTVVTAVAYNRSYLDGMTAASPSPELTLSLVGRTGVLSSSTGEQPGVGALERLARRVIESGT